MSETTAISACRGAYRETADGSLEVKIIIDPRFKDDFHRLFREKDMPVAIAPLVSDFERAVDAGNSVPEASREDVYTGLTKLAIDWCKEDQFYRWIIDFADADILGFVLKEMKPSEAKPEELCKKYILEICQIKSRKELNDDPNAAAAFQQFIRGPYMAFLSEKGLGQV